MGHNGPLMHNACCCGARRGEEKGGHTRGRRRTQKPDRGSTRTTRASTHARRTHARTWPSRFSDDWPMESSTSSDHLPTSSFFHSRNLSSSASTVFLNSANEPRSPVLSRVLPSSVPRQFVAVFVVRQCGAGRNGHPPINRIEYYTLKPATTTIEYYSTWRRGGGGAWLARINESQTTTNTTTDTTTNTSTITTTTEQQQQQQQQQK